MNVYGSLYRIIFLCFVPRLALKCSIYQSAEHNYVHAISSLAQGESSEPM